MQNVTYTSLEAYRAARGITKEQMASALNCSSRALYDKINGKGDFTWREVCTLRETFFPDLSFDELMCTKFGKVQSDNDNS